MSVMIISTRTDRSDPDQTEQSGQGLHYLPFRQQLLDASLYGDFTLWFTVERMSLSTG